MISICWKEHKIRGPSESIIERVKGCTGWPRMYYSLLSRAQLHEIQDVAAVTFYNVQRYTGLVYGLLSSGKVGEGSDISYIRRRAVWSIAELTGIQESSRPIKDRGEGWNEVAQNIKTTTS